MTSGEDNYRALNKNDCLLEITAKMLKVENEQIIKSANKDWKILKESANLSMASFLKENFSKLWFVTQTLKIGHKPKQIIYELNTR